MTPTQLYRHWDSAGRLLYVGISVSSLARLIQHNVTAHWAGDIARVTIQKYPTREAALAAELIAIRYEKPLYNVTHMPRPAATPPTPPPPIARITTPTPTPEQITAAAATLKFPEDGRAEIPPLQRGFKPSQCATVLGIPLTDVFTLMHTDSLGHYKVGKQYRVTGERIARYAAMVRS